MVTTIAFTPASRPRNLWKRNYFGTNGYIKALSAVKKIIIISDENEFSYDS